jgi:hypothetical protein
MNATQMETTVGMLCRVSRQEDGEIRQVEARIVSTTEHGAFVEWTEADTDADAREVFGAVWSDILLIPSQATNAVGA